MNQLFHLEYPTLNAKCASFDRLFTYLSCTAIFTMIFLSLNRYISVYRNLFYGMFFSFKTTAIICLSTWITPLLIVILPVLSNKIYRNF